MGIPGTPNLMTIVGNTGITSLCFPLPGAPNLGKMVGNMGLTSLCFPSSLSSPSALSLLRFSPGPSFPLFLAFSFQVVFSLFSLLFSLVFSSSREREGERERERERERDRGAELSIIVGAFRSCANTGVKADGIKVAI